MNRERLAQLIFWMRSFTEAELSQKVERRLNGTTAPNSTPPLREYLENLKRLGVLGFDGGRYFLRNTGKFRQRASA